MHSYDTSSQALADLKARGFTYDFNLSDTAVECRELGQQYGPEQFQVAEFYRFEGASDPDDMEIVYAIESSSGVRGTLVRAFGPYNEAIPERLRDKLRVH